MEEDKVAEGEEGEEEEADNTGWNDEMSSLIGASSRLYNKYDFYKLNVKLNVSKKLNNKCPNPDSFNTK